MTTLHNFPLRDIIISEEFKKTVPAEKKRLAAARKIQSAADLTGQIVINDNNVLIDGYTSYLRAIELGITAATITKGYVEIVEAFHYPGGRLYLWRVPPKLHGKLQKGDTCLVWTSSGIKPAIINNIWQQDCTVEQPRLCYVIKKLAKRRC